MLFFFFFKQKTAYEMRISDWSSDVCSSDLDALERQADLVEQPEHFLDVGGIGSAVHHDHRCAPIAGLYAHTAADPTGCHPGQASVSERDPGSRAAAPSLALDPRLKAEGDDRGSATAPACHISIVANSTATAAPRHHPDYRRTRKHGNDNV